MKAAITEDDIVITDIKATENRRSLLAAGVEISSAVAVVNADPAALTSNLNTAISSGAFTQALVADGYPSASASAVATVVETSPTAAPTPGPEKKAFPTGSAVGIAFGLFAAICLFGTGIYYFFFRAKSADVPAKDERGEEFGRGAYNNEDALRTEDVPDRKTAQANNL